VSSAVMVLVFVGWFLWAVRSPVRNRCLTILRHLFRLPVVVVVVVVLVVGVEFVSASLVGAVCEFPQ
jgi:hypothetical protein